MPSLKVRVTGILVQHVHLYHHDLYACLFGSFETLIKSQVSLVIRALAAIHPPHGYTRPQVKTQYSGHTGYRYHNHLKS